MEALLLPRRIAEALRRAAEAEGVCLEDLLLDWLTRGADLHRGLWNMQGQP